MRSIYLVAFLSLFSVGEAALAVDYVQCEAMEKAYGRTASRANDARVAAHTAYEDSVAEASCGKEPPMYESGWVHWVECKRKVVDIQVLREASAAGEKAEQAYSSKLEKIKTDYQEAGCN